jgi:hypothetical protein
MTHERQTGTGPSRRAGLIGIGALGVSVLGGWAAPARAEVRSRAVLREDEFGTEPNAQFPGLAVWSVETETTPGDRVPDTVLRARVAISARQMIARWTLRRNRDRSLAASHTIDILFKLPPDFQHGGIEDVPGVLMKTGESAGGAPLQGVAVKVSALYFVFGLSIAESDRAANMRLLVERAWFDVPIVYDDGRHATLIFEKGETGERALRRAFAAWGSVPVPGR